MNTQHSFPRSIPENAALLIVDVQNDFLPGGALAVSKGNEVAFVCRQYIDLFTAQNRTVILSRDWHPRNHCSFTTYGGIWPPHCVAKTPGAEFAAALNVPIDAIIVSKAVTPEKDAYSAFEGFAAGGSTLLKKLKSLKISTLFIGGLATDYCVRATCLDARRFGFSVMVLGDAVAAVNVKPDDEKRALEEMALAGCRLLVSESGADKQESGGKG
ncbi:MAG: isochorismatase family protein [Burkholderiales bacterium]|jgi:nicotinamidase/pyrazinamidase|nr:isochorismatase family protein [Burkholderiales bacterium]